MDGIIILTMALTMLFGLELFPIGYVSSPKSCLLHMAITMKASDKALDPTLTLASPKAEHILLTLQLALQWIYLNYSI